MFLRLDRLSSPRALFVSIAVASASVGLVVACTGGPGGLGEFGDDGLGQTISSTQTSSGSSSGRSSSSGASGTTTSSGASGTTSSSGASSGTTSSSGASSGTTSSGGSSGSTSIACGSTICSSASQYCVKPCCPTDPPCFAAPDSGGCGTGYQIGFCADIGTNGCVQTCKNTTTPYCTTNTSTSNLEGSCSTSTTTRTITCTCF